MTDIPTELWEILYDIHYGCGSNDEEFVAGEAPDELCCGCYAHKSCVVEPEVRKVLDQITPKLASYIQKSNREARQSELAKTCLAGMGGLTPDQQEYITNRLAQLEREK